jgi:predicted RNase H-like nuclease (RuvC/YqgF family)
MKKRLTEVDLNNSNNPKDNDPGDSKREKRENRSMSREEIHNQMIDFTTNSLKDIREQKLSPYKDEFAKLDKEIEEMTKELEKRKKSDKSMGNTHNNPQNSDQNLLDALSEDIKDPKAALERRKKVRDDLWNTLHPKKKKKKNWLERAGDDFARETKIFFASENGQLAITLILVAMTVSSGGSGAAMLLQ